jgi:serine/threonine-protein kinase
VLTGRRLALKSLHDETAYGRLEQEARATSLMKNGHAVKITDMGTNAGSSPYIVMELLEGQSLRTLLDDTGQLPLELTINIALQVTECLAEAHQHGIVHRDLKPDNVYLCPGTGPGQYDVKVLDFGVVKIDSGGPIPNSSLTRTGSTVGTPFYMSLEQLRNSSAVDQRADIYALGVVLYEALSGRKPYQAETIGDLVYALCSGPPTHLNRLRPDLPAAVCDVIMRALSSSRDQRQPTMIDLAGEIVPFGDPTYGIWLKHGDAKRRANREGASEQPPAHPAKGSLTPSGVKAPPAKEPAGPTIPRPEPRRPPGSQPPAEERWDRRQQAVPVDDDRRSGADRRQNQVPVAEDRRTATDREAAAQKPPHPPPSDRGGDRDTPTEMYVKAVHGTDTPMGGSPAAGIRAIPLGSEARPQLDSRPTGDRDTPTRAMEAVPAPRADETARMPPGSPDDFMMTRPLHGNTTPMPDARGSFPSNPFGPPPQPSAQVSGPISALSTGQSHAIPGLRPAWQEKLDRALIRVGGGIERLVRGGSHRFRAASPRAQIIIVVAAASLFAAVVVLTIWLLTG